MFKYVFQKDFFILLFFIIFGEIIAFFVGRDISWDLANYHYYSVWALFHNRIGFDIMPAGIQSYFNPLIDFPLYFLIKLFNEFPIIITFFLSLSYGFAAFFGYKITSLVFTGKYKNYLILLSVIISSTGFFAFHVNGLSNGDIFLSIFNLGSIYFLLKNIFKENSKQRNKIIFLSSLVIGLSVGLKLTNTICAVGIFIAEIFMYKKINRPDKVIIATFCGILVGTLITGGWWYAFMIYKFGNPVFPACNNIFHSPYAFIQSYRDTRFSPDNTIEAIFFPFVYTFGNQYKAFYFNFFDTRTLFAYISIFMLICSNIISKILKKPQDEHMKAFVNTDIFYFLTILTVASYIYWLVMFATLRYLQFLEFIVGIFIVVYIIYLSKFKKSKRFIALISICLCSFIIFSTDYMGCRNSHRFNYNGKFLDFENLNLPDDSLLCFCGGFPATFSVPFQNPKMRVVYLYGEGRNYNFVYPENEEIRIKHLIDNNKHRTYMLYGTEDYLDIDWNYISNFINKDDFDCKPVNSTLDGLYKFCSPKQVKNNLNKK